MMMMTKRLHRAANSDLILVGFSLAENLDDAEAYLDNPGFGGSKLWVTDVSIDDGKVLDLAEEDDCWTALSAVLGYDVEPSRHQFTVGRIFSDDDICEQLAELGYDWVRFTDDFPEDCITYIPVSAEAADAAFDATEELS